jgi:hypothetical protein
VGELKDREIFIENGVNITKKVRKKKVLVRGKKPPPTGRAGAKNSKAA